MTLPSKAESDFVAIAQGKTDGREGGWAYEANMAMSGETLCYGNLCLCARFNRRKASSSTWEVRGTEAPISLPAQSMP